MGSFADALRALNSMKAEGVVEDYAVAGAMALVFWTEPVATYDLDVLVFLPKSNSPVVTLEPVYKWARDHGFVPKDEHLLIAGVPTQLLPSPNALADEAIRDAANLEYEGVPVRVVRPTYARVDWMRSSSVMGSQSDRPRPSPELVGRLRQGKDALREHRRAMSLRDKVRQVLELQRVQLPLLARQRPLRWWERPWDVEP